MTEKFTMRRLMQEAQREVGFRRYVYPRRIAEGRMRQDIANRQIAMMEAIALILGRLAQEQERAELLPLDGGDQ